MKTYLFTAALLIIGSAALAQEESVQEVEASAVVQQVSKGKSTLVELSSHSFVDGVHTTFAVTFENANAKDLELFWKKQLKDMSEDIDTKKQLTAIGVRVPTIHKDTIRILAKAAQTKKSPHSVMHLSFIVDHADVGTREGDRAELRVKACRNFVYTRSIQFKREIIEAQLATAHKSHGRLEKALAGLVKEKARAEKAMEKNRDRGSNAEKEKAKAESELKSLVSHIETKQAEVATDPSEVNTSALNQLVGEREKATALRDKSAKLITTSDKKVKDLQHVIKKNIEDQGNTQISIDTAKELVETITKKLAELS